MSSASYLAPSRVSYISAAIASAIDAELMHPEQGGFSIDQLMELAGLACAQAVFRSYPPDQAPSVLVACGPGNQGGDGLVAARHLLHFGYIPRVWYPKRGKTELFSRLVQQLNNLEVEFIDQEDFEDALENADVVLDAIFGFSFKGEVREPFREPLELLKNESRMEFESRRKLPPIVSVDIPSAWDVDEGNIDNRSFVPQVLISLTAPKLGARTFQGRHFLGGRFLPPAMAERYGIVLPLAFTGGNSVGGGGGPDFGLGTGSSAGTGSCGRSAASQSKGGSASGVDGDEQDPSSTSAAVTPSASKPTPVDLQQTQNSSSAGAPAAGSSTSSSAAPASYFPGTPTSSTSPNFIYDDSQIIEITGAEALLLREPTPTTTAESSSSSALDADTSSAGATGPSSEVSSRGKEAAVNAPTVQKGAEAASSTS
ncbi:hypothetical protein OC845_002351 [Tilletia horrida]|nr:hypothetical protein OC845_002351 [Tilletia horrida]